MTSVLDHRLYDARPDASEYTVPLSVEIGNWAVRETSLTRDYWIRQDMMKFARRAAGLELRIAELERIVHGRTAIALKEKEQSVACPECGQGPGSPCVSERGYYIGTNHSARSR